MFCTGTNLPSSERFLSSVCILTASFLTFLGISNLNVQKKERLITDETIRSQGGTIASRYSRLNARRQACEEINKMFGLDIWVDYREDYREAGDVIMLAGQTGDESLDTLTVDV